LNDGGGLAKVAGILHQCNNVVVHQVWEHVAHVPTARDRARGEVGYTLACT
jgi:hypothetical protein